MFAMKKPNTNTGRHKSNAKARSNKASRKDTGIMHWMLGTAARRDGVRHLKQFPRLSVFLLGPGFVRQPQHHASRTHTVGQFKPYNPPAMDKRGRIPEQK